ncbi:TonB-dependent receptor [Microbulbifer spongiae]|uniref:TonB-dependent receptor n=1 Tax=Microbulbifer spongiae TaxID=2944933 RepID=A0ABY9EBZ6_9GAMM|nr:TonB-dependent receptor [Microbulbifer sp. MI-G]WKD49034.1 TonB-dependent receptor [Microbulbifer sp. MI-G]
MRNLHNPKKLIIQAICEMGISKPITLIWYGLTGCYLVLSTTAVNAQSNEKVSSEQLHMEEVIVTSQRIEENIQNVPIAVTAISEEALRDLKIERGDELLRAAPNVTFSKGNFNRYNLSIRGIGSKALSASSDPGVAVSFNNTPLLRDRLHEQEYFDVERVEVLRGPQGTLYGRNATGGVVNMLPRLPTQEFEADIKSEVGSYNTRRMSGMLNLPLSDTLAARVSGAMTKRDGYDYNTATNNDVNNRDLYSTRLMLDWSPSAKFNANLIWQHFEEDDQRSRTGKQLCTPDPGPGQIDDREISEDYALHFTQGCKPISLYDEKSYGAPNGFTLANFAYLQAWFQAYPAGYDADGNPVLVFKPDNPYKDINQSRDLRKIATNYDPMFNAENDVVQLNFEVALTDSLTFFAQSTYIKDDYYSFQDYSRFQSNAIFNDTSGLFDERGEPLKDTQGLTPGGVFMDPQLGATTGLTAVEVYESDSTQWAHELRLQSAFDGPINFSAGINYLDFESLEGYFLFNNTYSLLAEVIFESLYTPCNDENKNECFYSDLNSIENVDGEGHNYFYGPNPVETRSSAAFGELYWDLSDDVKLTTGLRYTRDHKITTPIPPQILLGASINSEGELETGEATGGSIRRGFDPLPDVVQKWNEFTGRIVLDWQARNAFTDETMFYVSYARGYKAGGTNPPELGVDPSVVQVPDLADTFEPEFVNAMEFGSKNTLLGGNMTFNTTAFFYDYKDYQVSKIVERSTLNENFDTRTFGLELEAVWLATSNTRFNANLGYLKTRIGDNEKSVDVLNRTQGNEDWTLLRPNFQVGTSCIAPTELVNTILDSAFFPSFGHFMLWSACPGTLRWGDFDPETDVGIPFDALIDYVYRPLTDAPNGGRGFDVNLGGNELPNSPNYTFNFGVEHIIGIQDWDLRLRADYYYQGESYARVYNTEYDRLKAWDNLNISATLTQPNWDFQVELYVKNVFDDAPIIDAFTNADDTGLSTNVFTLDPRIVGLSVYKAFGNQF